RAVFQSHGAPTLTEQRRTLVELARSEGFVSQPPSTVGFLFRILAGSGEPQEAVEVLRRGQLRHSGDFWGTVEQGGLLTSACPPEGAACLRGALAIRSDSPRVRWLLGVCLDNQGKWAEAEAECREAARRDPTSVMVLMTLGDVLHRQGRLVEAENAYREA